MTLFCGNREMKHFHISTDQEKKHDRPGQNIRRYIQGIRRDATALGEPTGNPYE
jgi:hypothetical protein